MVDLDTNLPEFRARKDLSAAGVAVLFNRAHNDKYQTSALLLVHGNSWLNLLDAESMVRNCCQDKSHMASDRMNVEAMRYKLYREALCGQSIGWYSDI
ncbi:hypothetical protein TNCV_980471 [Trichonephila clavipes]|uniref:Uncharacterized protein n=1 Tax=Trichonephila clavipes TaxID=2585209 RepID=A0A8X6S537_TRICX|nr:hypothetical protein TNCV_980471 [Trichonephila clavipes]